MNRRDFIMQMGAMAAGGAVYPRIASASLGRATLTTVSDGALVLPPGFLFDPIPEEKLAPLSLTTLEHHLALAVLVEHRALHMLGHVFALRRAFFRLVVDR